MFTLRSLWFWALGLILIVGLGPIAALYGGSALTDARSCVEIVAPDDLCEAGYYATTMGALMMFLSIPVMFVGLVIWAIAFAMLGGQKANEPENET